MFPNLYSFYVERKIRQHFAKAEALDLDFAAEDPSDLEDFTIELEAYQERQDERRKTIDDKAKSCLFVITVSTTLMLAGLSFVKEGKISFGYPLLILIGLGTAFFIVSVITSVKAMNVIPLNITHPNDWIVSSNGDKPITIKKPDKTHLLYRITMLNDYELNIRANFVSATLTGIRNGVLLLSLAFGFAILNLGNQIKYAGSTSESETPRSSGAKENKSDNIEVVQPRGQQSKVVAHDKDTAVNTSNANNKEPQRKRKPAQ